MAKRIRESYVDSVTVSEMVDRAQRTLTFAPLFAEDAGNVSPVISSLIDPAVENMTMCLKMDVDYDTRRHVSILRGNLLQCKQKIVSLSSVG